MLVRTVRCTNLVNGPHRCAPLTAGDRTNLTRTKENPDLATRPVTCGYHNASCELLLPHGPATCCVACKASALLVIIVAMIFFNPISLLRNSSTGSQNSTISLTKHFLFIVLIKSSNCTVRIIIIMQAGIAQPVLLLARTGRFGDRIPVAA
jgi:hypothetical protein